MKRTVFAIGFLALAGAATAAIMSDGDSSRADGPLPTHTVTRSELLVTVTEQGTLESSNNTEIKCQVRGDNTIIWVVDSGMQVKKDELLVKLETLAIEEEISERTKFYHLAKSTVARSKANVERAKIAIKQYEQGEFISSLASMEKNLAVAESRLLSSKNRLKHARMMAKSEYTNELEVEEKQFGVKQAELEVGLAKTRIDVLKEFTKREKLAELNGELAVAEATLKADLEREFADLKRLRRAEQELKHCEVVAARDGMVIYPSGKEWEEAPEIEEGARVHKDQVLLLMPDLEQMQVKVGIHESVVDRVRERLRANVTVLDKVLEGEVSYVASVAKPAGWWTGNVVKYDTIVDLPQVEGLKPGMSVEVEVVIARHDDQLLIPTAAVLEISGGHVCWVKKGDDVERRVLQLGYANELFLAVVAGLDEGEDVVLDPLANIEEAQEEAAKAIEEE